MEIFSIGGYSEVGKNMTALKVNNEIIIIDMGFFLPKLIDFEDSGGERRNLTTEDMIKLGVIPDDRAIHNLRDNVKAIIFGHGHLDHIGGSIYLSNKYDAPMLGTPYTLEVTRRIAKDEKIKLKNELKPINPNSTFQVSNNIEVELIHTTHSTLQTAMVAIHTREGTVVYANDFKFDNHPTIGKKPNYKRLRELGRENVIALVADSLYAARDGKTSSELIAREMLRDVLLGTENSSNAIIATTFASHIARLKSIVEFGEKLNRKVMFLGRSLAKYIGAAEKLELVDFSRYEIVDYANKIGRALRKVEREGRNKYLIICTGGQGEHTSVLNKIATGQFAFNFLPNDHVIFSNKTIPDPVNIKNRAELEEKLKLKKTRVFKEVHVSGHASREDLRELVGMLKPQHIIPSHGDRSILTSMLGLAEEMGYEKNRNFHISSDGHKLNL